MNALDTVFRVVTYGVVLVLGVFMAAVAVVLLIPVAAFFVLVNLMDSLVEFVDNLIGSGRKCS